jgi:hypothetical protein
MEYQNVIKFHKKKKVGVNHFQMKENFYGLVQHMFMLVRACSEHVHLKKIFFKKGANKSLE